MSADTRTILATLIDAAVPGDPAWLEQGRRIRASTGIAVFSEMIRSLTHLRLGEAESEELWPSLLAHWGELSAASGRDVGLFVAVLDWFVNVDRRLKDPTAVERAQLERTEKSAMTDWLSGLYNRGAFRAAALRELRRAQRYRQQISLVLFDIDDFKQVNDMFGHDRGDQVLRDISRLVRRSIRDVDVAARYGGDEFAILLPETGRLGSRAVAERVRTAVNHQAALRGSDEGDAVVVTISAGIAIFPDDGEELGDLLRQADVALYRAKSAGKNRVVSEWEERRSSRRIALRSARTQVRFGGDGLDGRGGEIRLVPGTVRDISESGVGLILPESCEIGQLLEMRVESDEIAPRAPLYGRVVRYQELRAGRSAPAFDIGVAFDEPSAREAAAAIRSSPAIASPRADETADEAGSPDH